MSVSTATGKAGPYVLTGSGQTLSVPFYFLEDSHIVVYSKASADATARTTLVQGTHYSVSGAGLEIGGSITLDGGGGYGTAGEIIVILRAVPFTQITDYIEGGGFEANDHETALDKLTMQTQLLQEVVARCIQLPPHDQSDFGQVLPEQASRKLQDLYFDADANVTVGSGLGSSAGVLTRARELAVTTAGSTNAYLVALSADDDGCYAEVIVHVPKNSTAGAEGYFRKERGVIRLIGGTYQFEAAGAEVRNNGSTESVDITFTAGASGVTIAIDGTNLAANRTVEVRVFLTSFSNNGDFTLTES